MLQPDLKQEKFCTPPSRHSGRYTHEITTCHVGIGFGLLPPRKQIPHRNWLETTTETSKFVKITSFVSRNLKLFVWNSESFPTSVLYIYTYIYISHYTHVLSSHMYFSNISIISSLATDACVLQATSLNWNVAVLQQNKFFKSKTTLFLALDSPKTNRICFLLGIGGGPSLIKLCCW